jgi:predicted PurR-regulated permease PerM
MRGGAEPFTAREAGMTSPITPIAPVTPSTIRPSGARASNYAVSGGVMTTTIFAVVVVAALYFARDILMPFALAVLLSFMLAPLLRKLQQWYVPRGLAVTSVVLLAFGVMFMLGTVILSQVNQLAGDLPGYQWTLREKIRSLRGAAGATSTLERASEVLQDLGKELQRPESTPGGSTAPVAGQPASPPKPVPVEVREPDRGALGTLVAVIRPLIHPLATMGLVIIFVIFILWQRQDLRNRLVRLAGSNDLHRTTMALNDAGQRLSRLFLTQLLLNASFGLVVGVGWWLIGVPSAALWGILVMVLRFLPYIGTWISAIFPLALAAAVGPDWTMFLWAAALFIVLDILIGQVIEPMVQGHSTGLSPVAVIASATFWTWLWGPIGLILATPITMSLAVLGRHIDSLKFLDVMFGDQPPLSPPELAYQRMLARDPVELTEEAWGYLKTKPLIDYYQDILLGGLRLAQADSARGMLDEAGRSHIHESIEEIVDDLQDHVDRPPAKDVADDEDAEKPLAQLSRAENSADASAELAGQWTAEGAVVCVPGNGALDHGLALVVAHLAQRRGFGVRVEKAGALSMSRIFSLDTSNARLICVCSIEDVTTAQIRYALRRLRRKAPATPIVVGLLGETEHFEENEVLAETVNVRFVKDSLQQIMDAIAAIARQDNEATSEDAEDLRSVSSA